MVWPVKRLEPNRTDSIEVLKHKLATARDLRSEASATVNAADEICRVLRVEIALREGTCLCEVTRHPSCQKRRGWCDVKDCLCDNCLKAKTPKDPCGHDSPGQDYG